MLHDTNGEKTLNHLKDHNSLKQHLYARCSAEAFTEVFLWLHKVLNFKQSTPASQAYMQSKSYTLVENTLLIVRYIHKPYRQSYSTCSLGA